MTGISDCSKWTASKKGHLIACSPTVADVTLDILGFHLLKTGSCA